MKLRRIIKATSGSFDENLKHGYVVVSFDLDSGTWHTEWRNMKETKVRVGISDTDQQTYETVGYGGYVSKTPDSDAYKLLQEWDKIRKGKITGHQIINKSLKEYAGIEGSKKAVELAIRRKINRLTTGA